MLEFFRFMIDFVLHIDKHLLEIVTNYQTWTYLILFAIIFCETGLVITPFLPGDSLIFAAGAIAAMPTHPLSLPVLILIFCTAAFTGDNTNYFIGRFLGQKVYQKNYKLIRRKYLDKTQTFYEKHGGKTLIIARFMPIVRTFAPFVAGVGKMRYPRFLFFCISGNLLWVNLFAFAGFIFANNSFVKHNFSLVILGIIMISVVPPIVTFISHKLRRA
jgi:membrane-associated protein